MRDESMTETIAEEIGQIKSTALSNSLDEAGVKQGVVLKLLNLAGWNTFDVVSEVVPEHTVRGSRVDFALKPGTANAVFLEVKRPSENLERHQRQLLDYCFQEGVGLAALTNGRTWWLYLPLRKGNWEQRRFLTIDLEVQEPDIAAERFMTYLSRDKVLSGLAVSDAENLILSQKVVATINETIIEAWKQIIETPDEILVDLISETTESICGFTDVELVKQFLSKRVHVSGRIFDDRSQQETKERPAWEDQGKVRPIALDPPNKEEFLAALLRAKKAWVEMTYKDGRKELKPWDASHMTETSNVMGNLRTKSYLRKSAWERNGIASVRVSIERPI